MSPSIVCVSCVFLSTLSLRRATCPLRQLQLALHHFYPRSPCGERRQVKQTCRAKLVFLSTLSLRRATNAREQAPYRVWISIHALLAESDANLLQNRHQRMHFYPRSPCGERQPGERHASSQQEFLSTLSLRRATLVYALRVTSSTHFYPRSPCGERPVCAVAQSPASRFLSTLSLRRATRRPIFFCRAKQISIHALLAESDRFQAADISAKRISIHALLAESDSGHR